MFEIDYSYNNSTIDAYLYEITMDEIRHSALSWITIKWMIDNVKDTVSLNVSNIEWWRNNVLNKLQNDDKMIIFSILDKIWIECHNYKLLYNQIVEHIRIVKSDKMMCNLSLI